MFETLEFLDNKTIIEPLNITHSDAQIVGFENIIKAIGWDTIEFLNMLQRNWFPGELVWRESTNCAGFRVSQNKDCEFRAEEMELITYTPQDCLDGKIENCQNMVAYARLNVVKLERLQAALQFGTTIFTCIVLAAGSIMFSDDTQKIIINPITKMVSIIKTLADDPLQKPEPPKLDDPVGVTEKNQMKTNELQKTIFRIGNLL